MVADDDVWIEAEMPQAEGRLENSLRPAHAVIQFAGGDMGFLDCQRRPHVRDLPHAGDLILIRFTNEQHLVVGIGRQPTYDVKELAWVVLMDKQEAHAGPSF